MRKFHLFSAVFFLFLLVPASITWAQVIKTLNGIVRYESGMSKSTFTTPNGDVVINLPQSLSGASISGTVSAVPSGKSGKEKARNLKELLKYVVLLDGQQIKVSATPTNFDWLTHMDRQSRTLVELLNISGAKLVELSLPPVLSAPATGVWQPDRTSLLTTPTKVLVKGDMLNVYTNQQFSSGEKFVITDSKGQMFTVKPICLSSNQAVMNLPQAASPGYCTVSGIYLGVDAIIPPVSFNLIDINLTSPNTNLLPGEKSLVITKVNVNDDDPQGIIVTSHNNELESIQIDLQNLNPNTVTMEGGNLHRVNINQFRKKLMEGEAARIEFQLSRTITGIKPGSFSVSATLHEDNNTSNDPFRPQLNVLKTPEDFNAWANALKKDLQHFAAVSYDDETGNAIQIWNIIKSNAQRAIDNMPVCTNPEQLDESKAMAYSLLQPLNVSKASATMWLSGVEAYKSAVQTISTVLAGQQQLIDWEIIKNGLYYFRQIGNKLGYDLKNKSDDAIQLIKLIRNEGQTNENLDKVKSSLEVLNMLVSKAINEMPAEMKMLLPGGILFSTKFTPPGTTDLPVEVTEIWWSGPHDIYYDLIAIAVHFTDDITLKQVSVRVDWVSKDGKKAGAADYIPKLEEDEKVNYHNCDTLRKYPAWPDDFKAATIINPLNKDEIDLEKVKVTVSVNGKKVGEGKPGEGRPGK
jgi:hypothetical protein